MIQKYPYCSSGYTATFWKRLGVALLMGFLTQLAISHTAQATHFRYGNLSWRQLPTDPTGRTIEFRLTMGFRYGYFTNQGITPVAGSTVANANSNSGAAFNFGDGTNINSFNFTVTTVNTSEDYIYGEATITHSYSAVGNYAAYIQSSARLSTLQNNANGSYIISSLVNVGSANFNQPPASSLPPIISLPLNQSAATFSVPASDPDGNALTYSLPTYSDLGYSSATAFSQPTGLSITSGGQATFDTRSPKAVGQLYNAVVRIYDGKAYVIVDFLIRIVAASDPPVFVYGGITPANNSTIQTYVGCPVSFSVQATDTDPTSNTITLQAVGLPVGATFSPVTGSNTVTSAFSFTPTTEGTSVVSFFAQDNVGNQTLTSVTLRVLQPLLTASPSLACVGTPIGLTATAGTSASGVTTYTFRGPNGIIQGPSSTSTASVAGLTAGVYTFSAITTNSLNSNSACTTTAVTSVTVESPPTVTLTSSGTITCSVPSVTLTASSSNTNTTSYAFRGPGLSQTGTSTTAVVSQSGAYSVIVTTVSGCTALATTTVASNTTAPAAPGVSVQQPTCTVATGAISVTSPTGTGLTYSIDGSTYQTSTTFSTLSAGTYPITVRGSNGCVSAITSVTITPQPATPAAPTVSVTQQPNCTIATGTITVSAPTGTGLTYSIDGSTYQSSSVFTVPGVNTVVYAVTVRNAAGCTSPATSVTVNQQPSTPSTPTASVTQQPNCTLATGTITISGPTGTGLTYSLDGTNYTTATSFTGVGAGTYAVTVRNNSGCTSTPTSVTVTPQPATPAAPTASVTQQPTCTLVTGTITVSAPTGTGLTYSSNGTDYTNTSGTFTNVSSGTYAVTVRNTAGCTSAATSVTVTPQPATPIVPTASVTQQPNCTLATGTITITGPTGTDLTYSINGTTYQSSTVFTGVNAGPYAVTVKNNSGCVSPATSVTVNQQPATPVAPTVSVTQQPNCTVATGTITVSAPTGTGLTYSIDGSTYQSSTVFTGVNAGTYAVTVRSTAGCTSAATSVTVTPQPATPAAPTATVTQQPNCTLATGTIIVSAPTGTGLTYSINGTDYTNTSGAFTAVSPGSYSVTVRNTAGCTSAATSLTVITQPASPTLTVNSATVCAGTSAGLTIAGCTGGTLQWSTGSNSATITVTPLITTTYSATCTSMNGCSTTIATTVTVRPTPTYSAAPTVVPATCVGTIANSNAQISLTGLSNTERADISMGSTYAGPAYGASTNQLVANNAVSFTNLPNPTSTQPYTVRLFAAQGACVTDVAVLLSPATCQCPNPPCARVFVTRSR